jgi:hypothetical protein
MNATLKSEITRLTKRQKLALADRLLSEAGLHAKPPGLLSHNDPTLENELRRRLTDKGAETWSSLSEFRLKAGLR